MRLKVQNEPGLYRDSINRGIINSDTSGYKQYLKQKEIYESREKCTKDFEDKILTLQEEVGNIKDLLNDLIKKLTKE